MATTFISDAEHYSKVLDAAAKARRTLWIGTADIKDLYVTQGKAEKPFLGGGGIGPHRQRRERTPYPRQGTRAAVPPGL